MATSKDKPELRAVTRIGDRGSSVYVVRSTKYSCWTHFWSQLKAASYRCMESAVSSPMQLGLGHSPMQTLKISVHFRIDKEAFGAICSEPNSNKWEKIQHCFFFITVISRFKKIHLPPPQIPNKLRICINLTGGPGRGWEGVPPPRGYVTQG